MTPDEFERIEALFHRLRGLPPAEHDAALADDCTEAPLIRAEVARLLAHDDPAATLEQLGRTVGRAAFPDEAPRLEIAGYDVLREIHRGGQGIVYQAIQKSTKRKVAIKVLLEGAYASASARKRFEREIELVAQFKHPNIISVFDSGTTSDGHLFCVMDYVRGLRLDQYVREKRMSIDAALALFSRVCDAVQYAHGKGVIHRDLKPSNILVDAAGQPRVLDFGLAKQVGGPEPSIISLTGQVVGTLPYMSPEQAAGNPDEIDIRTDVYALGVILYELLTGQYPYPVAGKMAEVLRHIAETPPTPPSRAWSAGSGIGRRAGRRRGSGGAATSCPIDDEIQTIVLQSLAKERGRRYQSAAELARDIGHYLAGEAIEAKRDSGWYVLRKQLQRYRAHTAVAAGFVVLLAGFGVAMSVLASRNRQLYEESRKAFENERIAHTQSDQVTRFMQNILNGASPWLEAGFDKKLLKKLIDDATHRIERDDLAAVPGVDCRLRVTIGSVYQQLAEYDSAHRVLDAGLRRATRELGERNPTTAALHEALGTLYHEEGNEIESLKHAEAALSIFQENLPGHEQDVATCLNDVAGSLAALGRYQPALEKHESALALRKTLSGNHDDEIASSLNHIGGCHAALGRPDLALPYFEQARALKERAIGSIDHPSVSQSLQLIASCLMDQDRPREALDSFEQAVRIAGRVFPEGHPSIAVSQHNLASCLKRLGRYADALETEKQALGRLQIIYQSDHPYVAKSMSNVADCLERLGRPAEALPYEERSLEIRKRLNSEPHPDIATGLANLAAILYRLKQLDRATDAAAAALEMRRSLFTGDHPAIAASMTTLGNCLMDRRQLDDALKLYRQALDMRQRIWGNSHIDVAVSRRSIAGCLARLGNFAAALDELGTALNVLDSLETGDEFLMANLLVDKADCLRALGRAEEALAADRASLDLLKRAFQGDHPALALGINRVGAALLMMNRPQEARPILEQGEQMRWRLKPSGDEAVLRSMTNLINCLQSIGDFAAAISKSREALDLARLLFPGDDGHAEVVRALNTLGYNLRAAGRRSEAPEVFREALAMMQRLTQDDDADKATAMNNIACCLLELDRPEEAVQLSRDAVAMCAKHEEWSPELRAFALETLARALARAGEVDESVIRFAESLNVWRVSLPNEGEEWASRQVNIAVYLLAIRDRRAAVKAESILRECLSLRRKLLPDDHPRAWLKYNTMSLLGEALVLQVGQVGGVARSNEGDSEAVAATAAERQAEAAQSPALSREERIFKLREAEPLLLSAWERLMDDPNVPPPEKTGGEDRRRQALERIVRLYEIWAEIEPDASGTDAADSSSLDSHQHGKEGEVGARRDYHAAAAQWRAKLKQEQSPHRPAATQNTAPPAGAATSKPATPAGVP